ncbi:helix-turn-helix transcriptional regulator [Streptomyces sp. N50]|uniref:helix-turn-helix transcriptional regulator n=1 Tax=Streptomyces sp. N50 TaxID=3081765 RepID=UPI002961F29E|nr:LuxR C-terminal-related transcriptional regulator [Streptomyces sp. N50]WOX10359.1 LuxR C-terminal-related transcriptional regulator [Streptomyces sp. N50]
MPGHVAALPHRRTEGWAAGLRLAVLSLAGHAVPRHGTSHAALVIDIVDTVRDPGRRSGTTTPAAPPARELSRSELRVLRCLPTSLTRRDIAGELSVSLNTVGTHIRRISSAGGSTGRRSRAHGRTWTNADR